MPNFSPLSSTVSFDDLLKANKQQFDSIFSTQTKELGLLGASHRPPTTADLASASLSSEAAAAGRATSTRCSTSGSARAGRRKSSSTRPSAAR